MAFKSLLVPIQDSPESERVLGRAVEFATRTGADITGVMARPPLALVDPWIMSGGIVQQLVDDQTASIKAAEQRFANAARPLNGRSHWIFRQDFPNIAVRDEAAVADLILTSNETGPQASVVDLSGLLLESGVPVVVFPEPAPEFATRNIMIAWRNTAEARRAVTAALPLLQTAETVTLVQIGAQDEADEARAGLRAVETRLARNGIKAHSEFVARNADGEAWSALEAARNQGAELIVLGAYGHSRAREWVLGGMTRDLLETTTIPLFLVH